MTNYWLLKTEPGSWSWEDQKSKKTTFWDGVRNYQANNNMKKMALGDLCFFYHSVKEKQIMGIVKVIETHHLDPSDPTGRFGGVTVEYVKPLKNPVTLAKIKSNPHLSDIPLVRQSRLSVMPINKEQWNEIINMS